MCLETRRLKISVNTIIVVCEDTSQTICKSSGQLVLSPGGLLFVFYLPLGNILTLLSFSSASSDFKTLAYVGNTDERVMNVIIYGLFFGYYEGTHFMIKLL